MYKRHSIRLPNYDYSEPGFYFITICTKNKKHILSSIDFTGNIHLTKVGSIIEDYLIKNNYYFNINQYVIMPNHIHILLEITSKKINVGNFVKEFKSKVCRKYNKLYGYYENDIWQRNYYEHIVRDESDLIRIKNYIKNNPYKWIKY